MNFFFEKIVSRRDFLKKCGLLFLGGFLSSKLIKFANAQEGRLGLIKAQKALYYKKLPKN
ncbi:MAG TPA: twin-arginine translocation signal domain-containing protein, partial [candidate division WOR-3 bacterium]|nr:twin-arginine translocation signal domain-containing protein [candidate division WOR-3 bacterium]